MLRERHLEACIPDANSHQRPSSISFLHFVFRVPSEMEITKIRRAHILGRPSGMCGGAGERFEGGLEIYRFDLRIRITMWVRHDSSCLRQGRRIQLKALRGGQHRRPLVSARHAAAVRRKEACKANSAIAGERHHEHMHARRIVSQIVSRKLS